MSKLLIRMIIMIQGIAKQCWRYLLRKQELTILREVK